MAIVYQLESDTESTMDGLFGFFRRELPDAVVMDPDGTPYLRLSGMDTSPYMVDPDDPDESENRARKLGFPRRVLVLFRIRGPANERARADAERQMIRAVLAFFEAHPGNGVLLHNGELAIVERRDGVVTLNEDWSSELFDEPHLADLVNGLPRRALAQPLM